MQRNIINCKRLIYNPHRKKHKWRNSLCYRSCIECSADIYCTFCKDDTRETDRGVCIPFNGITHKTMENDSVNEIIVGKRECGMNEDFDKQHSHLCTRHIIKPSTHYRWISTAGLVLFVFSYSVGKTMIDVQNLYKCIVKNCSIFYKYIPRTIFALEYFCTTMWNKHTRSVLRLFVFLYDSNRILVE